MTRRAKEKPRQLAAAGVTHRSIIQEKFTSMEGKTMVATYRESRKDFNVSSEDQGPQKKGRKNPNWPTLLQRQQWATERTVSMALRGVESAILKHVVYVDGIGAGFFQNQETTMKETGWSHTAVSRALASLTKKGLLEAERRVGRTTKYCLVGIATMPLDPIPLEDGGHPLEGWGVIPLEDGGHPLEGWGVIPLEDGGHPLEGWGVIPLEDGGHPLEGQQNPVCNQEELTSNLLSELSESGELKNISGTGGQDDHQDDQDQDQDQADQWKPPELAPKLFKNPIAFSKFIAAFQSGDLTRNWAHELQENGGGVTVQEIWGYEMWFADTHRITKADDYEKMLEDNIRRLQEEHGPATVEEIAA